ncbi:hypothetical protein [Priestia filamentosa]|uniref:hypothetical protein n=1 Tax=Priestia filamentosa TaxID=1402861 RepID=UPI002E22217D|nr:hypothetical protein [Priestia filamentosa]
MGTIQADLNELKNLEQKTKNTKAKIDAIPGQLSFSLSGVLSELSGVWNGELEGLQQELEKSIREYSEELGRAEQVVSKTHQELKAADEALLQALGLDSEIAPQKTSKEKAAGASKKKKEKEEGNAFTQSLKGIGDGAGDALSDTWDGIVSFAKHPVDSTVDTAKGVYEAGKHPIRTYNTVKDGVVTAVDEKLIHGDAYSRSHFFSYAGTEIGLAAIGDKGAGLAVKGASGSKKLLKEAGKNVKEAHKATVKQKVPALQPAVAGARNIPPRNVINMDYVNNLLQNLKGMNWSFSKVLHISKQHDYVAHDGYYTRKELRATIEDAQYTEHNRKHLKAKTDEQAKRISETGKKAAQYLPHINNKELEKKVMREGKIVDEGKGAVYFFLQFDEPVGYDNGKPAYWVRAELTNVELDGVSTYHGHPRNDNNIKGYLPKMVDRDTYFKQRRN